MPELRAEVNLPLQHFLPPRHENDTVDNFDLCILNIMDNKALLLEKNLYFSYSHKRATILSMIDR